MKRFFQKIFSWLIQKLLNFPNLAKYISRPIVVAQGGVSDAQLQGILADVASLAGFKYMIWQTAFDFDIDDYATDEKILSVDEAQAFGPLGEVHWKREMWETNEQESNIWRVVYIGEKISCPADFEHATQKTLRSQTTHETVVKLWGERKAHQDAWLEVRIPRRLDYPQEMKSRFVGLKVIQYLKNGRVDFVRLVDLVDWSEVN